MKDNLSLIQPYEYNNLFSSYHKNGKLNRYLNYKLPKIKLFPSQENRIQGTSTFFNKNLKSKIIPPKINIFKGIKIIKQKKLKNSLNILNTESESNNNSLRKSTSNSTINQNRIKAKAVQGNFTYLVMVI